MTKYKCNNCGFISSERYTCLKCGEDDMIEVIEND